MGDRHNHSRRMDCSGRLSRFLVQIGHLADDFRVLEQIAGISCVEKRDVAAWRDPPFSDVREHPGEAFGSVDRAQEDRIQLG